MGDDLNSTPQSARKQPPNNCLHRSYLWGRIRISEQGFRALKGDTMLRKFFWALMAAIAIAPAGCGNQGAPNADSPQMSEEQKVKTAFETIYKKISDKTEEYNKKQKNEHQTVGSYTIYRIKGMDIKKSNSLLLPYDGYLYGEYTTFEHGKISKQDDTDPFRFGWNKEMGKWKLLGYENQKPFFWDETSDF